jgi:hypothetical protein
MDGATAGVYRKRPCAPSSPQSPAFLSRNRGQAMDDVVVIVVLALANTPMAAQRPKACRFRHASAKLRGSEICQQSHWIAFFTRLRPVVRAA